MLKSLVRPSRAFLRASRRSMVSVSGRGLAHPSLTSSLSSIKFENNSRLHSSTAAAVKYARAADHVDQFRTLVGAGNVITDDFDMDKYRHDWKRNFYGGSLVVTPTSTEQISAVMKYCNDHQIGVVVQGGNTGLVGGAVGTDLGELILSMEKLNKIIKIDAGTATVICEAGCVLEVLNNAVNEHGFIIPLDLGPKGSCQIGGNISTNAGGLRVVRYGSLQANILGLEVVQADGTVLDMLRTLYKDNTGYHLKHLFVGAEGTLGVVTKVALRLAVTPQSSTVLFAKVPSFQQLPKVLHLARTMLGANLSAFEFVDSRCLAAIRTCAPQLLQRVSPSVLPEPDTVTLRDPQQRFAYDYLASSETPATKRVVRHHRDLGIPGELSLLIEVTGTDPETDAMKLEKFAAKLLDDSDDNADGKLVLDAVVAEDVTQEKALWLVREQVAVALIDLSRPRWLLREATATAPKEVGCGYMFKFDLSLPLTLMAQVVLDTQKDLHALGFTVYPLARHLHRLPSSSTTTTSSSDTTATSSEMTLEHSDAGDEEVFDAEYRHILRDRHGCVLEFCNYGHAGDQNLHLNIHMRTPCRELPNEASRSAEDRHRYEVLTSIGLSPQQKTQKAVSFDDYHHHIHSLIDHLLYTHVLKYKGSISAEHGIGQEKIAALHMARSTAERRVMQEIKKALDPRHILNPNKMTFFADSA